MQEPGHSLWGAAAAGPPGRRGAPRPCPVQCGTSEPSRVCRAGAHSRQQEDAPSAGSVQGEPALWALSPGRVASEDAHPPELPGGVRPPRPCYSHTEPPTPPEAAPPLRPHCLSSRDKVPCERPAPAPESPRLLPGARPGRSSLGAAGRGLGPCRPGVICPDAPSNLGTPASGAPPAFQ